MNHDGKNIVVRRLHENVFLAEATYMISGQSLLLITILINDTKE